MVQLYKLNAPSPVEGEGYNKALLRKWAKEERSKLDMETLSRQLVQKLKETNEYQQSKNIMIFYPLENEVNLLELLDDTSKRFYLPKIEEKNLLCCPYQKNDELCISCFKTQEPLSEPVDKNLLDLVIVPALAVDKNYHRLGYGGGFYDRFLSDINCKKIVCIPQCFVIETVFSEKYDIAVDMYVSV